MNSPVYFLCVCPGVGVGWRCSTTYIVKYNMKFTLFANFFIQVSDFLLSPSITFFLIFFILLACRIVPRLARICSLRFSKHSSFS